MPQWVAVSDIFKTHEDAPFLEQASGQVLRKLQIRSSGCTVNASLG
jgi:hypothetical protein